MRYNLIILTVGCLLGHLALPAAAQRPLPLDSVLRAVQTRNPALRQYDYRARACTW
jgi:cobalt-zinc-cadmium efflux system outer membrane protein